MAEDAAGRDRLGSGAPVVLAVDDDEQFLALLVRSLRYEGFTADSVTSAAAALDYAARCAPDVVVLDIGLPGGTTVIVARSPLSTYRALAVLNNLLTAVTAGAMLLTALASWLYARAALRPIDRLVRAAGTGRDSRDLSQRVSHSRPPDELGRLGATFNGMLAELDAVYRSLDRSNERMRQFLADCSHELRAPLTRVRSAMDLLSRLGDEDPEFRSRTITAAATETDRMSALVRNLSLLARADRGANIQRRPVRLADVLTAALDRADRMADGLTLHTPAAGEPDGIVVDGDA